MNVKVTTKALIDAQKRERDARKRVHDWGDSLKSAGESSRPYYEAKLAEANLDLEECANKTGAISKELAGPVEAALAAVNGKATAHTTHRYESVMWAALQAERRLDDRGVLKKHRVGTELVFHDGSPSAKSYKYSVISTLVTLRRAADGWRMTKVERIELYAQTDPAFTLHVSPEAAGDITRKAMEGFAVRTEVRAAA